MQFIQTLILS